MPPKLSHTAKVQFPVIVDPDRLELNSWLYGKVGPKKEAGPLVHAAWKRSVMPIIIGMAKSPHKDEIRLLIEQCYPYVDACRLKAHKIYDQVVKPEEGHDPEKDKPFGRIIPPRPLKKTVAPVPAQIRRALAAMVVSSGSVDWPTGVEIEQGVPLRQIGELIGKSHQYVQQLVVTKGENSNTWVRHTPGLPEKGKGKLGINQATGGRRGSAAHPPTLYRYILDDETLQMARTYVEQHGYPQIIFPARVVEPPVQPNPVEAKKAKEHAKVEWVNIVEALLRKGINPDRITQLLSPLQPVAFREEDGRPVLTITGYFHYRALELIERVYPHQVRVLLKPPS